jgi:hypothetical protein
LRSGRGEIPKRKGFGLAALLFSIPTMIREANFDGARDSGYCG